MDCDSEKEPSWPSQCTPVDIPVFNDARDEIIKHFTNLSCKLTFDKSLNAIKGLKAQHPELFTNSEVQFTIFKLMEQYAYQLPPRRFFNQIFSVYWSQEKLEALPPYEVKPWHVSTDFATYSPSSNIGWSGTKENRSLRRNSIRGSFGVKSRPNSKDLSGLSLGTQVEQSSTPNNPSPPVEEKSPETFKPQIITPDSSNTPEDTSDKPAIPSAGLPKLSRRSPQRGRGVPRGLPPRGMRGAPPRGRGMRGVPLRPPRREAESSS